MALIKCKDCGHEISKKAKACPNCGAKNKRTSVFTYFVLAIILLTAAQYVFSTNKASDSRANIDMPPEQIAELEKRKSEEEAGKKEAEMQATGLAWSYATSADQMSGKPIKSARLKSRNVIEFPSPYRGTQRGELIIRDHPRFGKDIIISVEKGQILCRIGGCEVTVRFGDGNPVKYKASGPDSHSSTTLFVKNYDAFLGNLRKVDRISIEIPVYQVGGVPLHFNVAELKWP